MKAISLDLLHGKPDGFRLKEFIRALKAAYDLAIPQVVLN
jgi:hypothetical protein